MFFTEEDYKKIEKYLASCGVKDSCLEDAKLPIEGNEKIAIVQNGENRILYIRELIEALSNSKASLSDLYNVTDHAKEKYINLKQAIELVPYKARKIGQIITFLNPASKWELYQFQGTSILQWNELSLWNDFFNLDSYVIKSILPDEEDLTKSENDGKGNSYLSLKDREYNPDEFSGLGKVILRKNIMEVETEEYGKVKKNVLLQDMINKPNTIYEIRYDFDLNNQEITIPEGCVLDFQGGSFRNGYIVGSESALPILNGYFENISITFKNGSLFIKDTYFEGSNKKQYAIKGYNTKIITYNVNISNYGNKNISNSNGIWLLGNCSESIIEKTNIENIVAITNASGIQFTIKTDNDSISKNFRILNCNIKNINGIEDDGDGIKIINSDIFKYYSQYSNSIIQNCNFYNCSKRAIKIQGVGIKVRDIYIKGDCSFAFIDFQRAEAYAENIKCVGNTYRGINSSGVRNNVYLNNIQFDFTYKEDFLCNPIIIGLDNSFNDESQIKERNIYINNCTIKKYTNRTYSAILIQNSNKEKVTIDNVYVNNIILYQSAQYTPNISIREVNIMNAVLTNIVNKDTDFNVTLELLNTSINSLMSNVFYVRSNGFSCQKNIAGLYSTIKLSIHNINNILVFQGNNKDTNEIIQSPNCYNVVDVNDIIIGKNKILICVKKPDDIDERGLYRQISLSNLGVQNFKYLKESNAGNVIFNKKTNSINIYDGEKYINPNGFDANFNNKGYTVNRPVIEKGTNLGFQYYDTNLKKYIVWNGTEWTNMDGTSL